MILNSIRPPAMLRLLGALLLVPLASALSVREVPAEEEDSWIRSCEARALVQQADELDYGPCFDDPELETEIPDGASYLLGSPKPHTAPPATMFTQVDEYCDLTLNPLSDRDAVLGHGNPACRYEPTWAELHHYHHHPEDVAIVIPSNRLEERPENMSDDPSKTDKLNHGTLTWKKYAKYHNYAFYSGMPENADVDCPGLEERHAAWTKPCMAMQLIKKHKYLLIVDRDTTVIKPRLRLEPLFAMAGLMNESGKIMAVAEEWGSCKKGMRCPNSGDVNTGVVLVRQSPEAIEALENWFYGPTRCQGVVVKEIARYKGWPFTSAPCSGCGCIMKGVHKWSYDQVGFFASIANNESTKDKVTIFRTGCPINSPFADFIPHLISGTPTHKTYNIEHRAKIAQNLHICNSELMEGTRYGHWKHGDQYTRCDLCSALPKVKNLRKHGSWSESCPEPPAGAAPQK